MYLKALLYISFVNVAVGRDFVIGMFKHSDILVTQDIVYKEKVPFGETTFKYGKTFACCLTYFRVADRLGFSHGPKVKVIRGGLKKMYIVVKIWTYNLPIAVTIQAGCQAPKVTTSKSKEPDESADDESNSDTNGNDENNTTNVESDEEEEAGTKTENDESEAEEEATGDDADAKGTTGIENDDAEGMANENESLRSRNHSS